MSKSEEMNTVDGPLAVLCKVIDDSVQVAECRSGVGVLDDFTKRVKGGVPLVGILVEKGDSVIT